MRAGRKSKSRMNKIIVAIVILTFVFCGIGMITLQCSGATGPSRNSSDGFDHVLPIVAGQNPNPTTEEMAFINHLRSRGLSAKVNGEWEATGWMICGDMVNFPERSLTAELSQADTFTNNHLLSVIIADAAMTHLCPGVDL